MAEAAAPVLRATAAVPAHAARPHAKASKFHEFLSELNPLQYVPVLGTIYRAVTGDTISETVRTAGSFVVSGLLGGPIGLATGVATLAAEKITGIDPEKIGHDLLADIGIGTPAAAPGPAAPAPKASPAPQAATPAPASLPAWSPAQLSAYGVTISPDGVARRGSLQGAEALNDAELNRLDAVRIV